VIDVGLFVPTTNNGWIASKSSPQFIPDWHLTRQSALKAEHYGFKFLLTPSRLRGVDGATELWNHNIDSFSVTAGLAAVTSRIQLYATVATLLQHPVLTAKQAATMSEMSGGRVGLNIVAGWNKPEYESIGIWPGDDFFAARYERAAEYLDVMQGLWERSRIDYDGRFFQLKDCMLYPQPEHRIPLVCAGSSDQGLRLTANYADYQFISCEPDVAVVEEHAGRLASYAADAGRDVGALLLYMIVQRDTEEEAQEAVAQWREDIDVEAIANMRGQATSDVNLSTDSTAARTLTDAAMFGSIAYIASDAEGIAERLRTFGSVDGVKGVMVNFPDYVADIDRFGKSVMPILDRMCTTTAH
jgi:pyrimidine oxygenase